MRLLPTFAAVSTALSTLALASAAAAYDELGKPCPSNPLYCEEAPIKFDKLEKLPIEWSFDTGWVPQNSPLEVRITAGVFAHTEVSLEGQLKASWPYAMTLEAPGTPGTGDFLFHYGAEFSAQGKIDVDVLGQHFGWTGNLPYLPQFDFEVEAEQMFNPWAWSPGITIASTTTPQRIATISIGDIIGGSIPGIDGGFELDVAMELSATYHTEKINMIDAETEKPAKDGPIIKDQSKTRMSYTSGSHIDVTVQPEGQVDYDGTLHVIPAFYVSILGQDFSIPIADIPISFPITNETWEFDPTTVRIPLPDLYLDEKVIDFGKVEIGDGATKPFHAWNAGEALLHAELATDDSAFDIEEGSLDIKASLTHKGKVSFSPRQEGKFEAHLSFQSNDPSDPVEYIVLKGEGVAPPPEMTTDTDTSSESAVSEDGGCGCRASGESPTSGVAGLALFGVALAIARRRRSRRA